MPEIEGQEDPRRAIYPLQVLSCASHYFIGGSFQSVPRLQAMMSRPTVEISPGDAMSRNISDGDLCRLYNDRGETFAHAVIIEKLLDGVCNTQKQFKGSNTYGGVNINALNSEMLTDFGNSPTFYSCLIEIEVASDQVKKDILIKWGGEQGFIQKWRNDKRNKGIEATDQEIIAAAKEIHKGVFS